MIDLLLSNFSVILFLQSLFLVLDRFFYDGQMINNGPGSMPSFYYYSSYTPFYKLAYRLSYIILVIAIVIFSKENNWWYIWVFPITDVLAIAILGTITFFPLMVLIGLSQARFVSVLGYWIMDIIILVNLATMI